MTPVVLAAKELVELCSLNAAVLREDLALMESGTLKVQMVGADVTDEMAARLRANLSRLRDIIEELNV